MKKIVILALCCALSSALVAQNSATAVKAPAAAAETVKAKFPSASNISWKLANEKYIADFKNGGNAVTAYFDKQGNFIESLTPIAEQKLPSPVKVTVGSEFKGFATSQHSLIETAANETFYKVVVDRGTELVELRINPEGSILNTVRTRK